MRSSNNIRWLVASLSVLLVIACATAFDPRMSLANQQALPSDNPLSGDEVAIEAGRKTFNTFCAQCHGVAADGVAPRFGKYSADLRKFNKGFFEFAGIVAEGIVDKQMPPWADVFEGDEISEIGAYLETLAIDGAKWATDQ